MFGIAESSRAKSVNAFDEMSMHDNLLVVRLLVVGAKNSTIFKSFVESVLHFKRLGAAYWPGRNLVSTLLLEYELYVYRRQYSLPVHVIITVHARETPRRYLWPYSGRWRCMLPHTTRHCCPLSWRPHP